MIIDDQDVMPQLIEKYQAVNDARKQHELSPSKESKKKWTDAAIEYNNFCLRIAEELEKSFQKEIPPVKPALRKPPVNIDDTLYFIINGDVYKATVVLMSYTEYRNNIVTELRGEVHPFHTVSVTWDDWNVKVFRTEEEAYANLTNKKGVIHHYDT